MRKRVTNVGIIALMLALALSFCSCNIEDILGIDRPETIDYTYDSLVNILNEKILEKTESYEMYVSGDGKTVSHGTIKEHIQKYQDNSGIGAYFTSMISYNTVEYYGYTKLSLTFTYRDDAADVSDYIQTDGMTDQQIVLAICEKSRDDNTKVALQINDASLDENYARKLMNTVCGMVGTAYNFNEYSSKYMPEQGDDRILHLELFTPVDEEKWAGLNEKLDDKVAKISQQIKNENKGANKRTLCRKIHDYLIDNIEYDDNIAGDELKSEDVMIARSAYGALVNGKTICGGYSEAFYLLYNEVIGDGDCWVAVGYTKDEDGEDVGHAWNSVIDGDTQYYIDCTWDDYDDGSRSWNYFYEEPDSKWFNGHRLEEQYVMQK